MSDTNSSSGGIGFVGLLTIVFIVLKLTNVIAWSWWWVLSPLWISFGLVIVGLLIFGIVLLGIYLSERRKLRARARIAPRASVRGWLK